MPSSPRRVALAILALGLPVLLAVLGWSGMLLSGGLARDVSLLGATAVLLLASYRWLVRGTFIGVFLNGRRYPKSAPLATSTSTPSISPG